MMLPFATKTIFRSIVHLLFPPKCPICGKPLLPLEQTLCHRCNDALPRTDFHAQEPNSTELSFVSLGPRFKKGSSFLNHLPGSLSSSLIYKIKYAHRPDLAIALGRILAVDLLDRNPEFFSEIDLLVPVPITSRRKRQRGYNQSEKLAEGISQITKIPIDSTSLRRVHFHTSQTKLDATQRKLNTQGAFSLTHPQRLEGKHILLIDDVITYGFTLKACSQELLKAPQTSLSLLTLATAKPGEIKIPSIHCQPLNTFILSYKEGARQRDKGIISKIENTSDFFC